MEKAKRNIRTYKATDKDYFKAKKIADKRKASLAKILELVVISISMDMDIRVIRKNDTGNFSALDIWDNKTSLDITRNH